MTHVTFAKKTAKYQNHLFRKRIKPRKQDILRVETFRKEKK